MPIYHTINLFSSPTNRNRSIVTNRLWVYVHKSIGMLKTKEIYTIQTLKEQYDNGYFVDTRGEYVVVIGMYWNCPEL
jgi:hypothetical protein